MVRFARLYIWFATATDLADKNMCIMYNRFVSELKLYMHLRHEAEAVVAYGGNIVLCDNFVTCSIVMERVPMTLHKFLALHPNLKLPHKLAIISGLIKLLRFLKRMEFSHSDIKVRSSNYFTHSFFVSYPFC